MITGNEPITISTVMLNCFFFDLIMFKITSFHYAFYWWSRLHPKSANQPWAHNNMIWTFIAHVTTFLNLAKQRAEISVVTIYGQSATLEKQESCGIPHRAYGYVLLMPLCITKPLYQQTIQGREEWERSNRVRERLSLLGSTVALI